MLFRSKLRGSETMYVQVDSNGVDASDTLRQVAGVTRVGIADSRGGATGFEIESGQGQDIRRDLAAAIVRQGWGLLELRPMRMSLEDIFLSLTTEDTAAAGTTEAAHG